MNGRPSNVSCQLQVVAQLAFAIKACMSVAGWGEAFVCNVLSLLTRLWQNSPHSSKASELQTLKNAMFTNTNRMRKEQRDEIEVGV